ncbi:MAG: S41 family peptidase [Lachnospiraceae bacterium]|nr:S41 family peptidase [Lachnospiraceae bacterium]
MENGYYSSAEEWREAKATAQDALRAAQSYEDTWPILSQALYAAGGKHSRLITPMEETEAREDPITLPLVSTDSMEHGIVTLVIPEFTQGAEQAQEYTQIVLSWLREHQDAAGVILDLRENRGGDLAPMICALSPLLPDGPLLGTRYVNGQMNTMTLADGAFSGGSGMTVESFKMPETIPIAILTDEWTGSSGEAVLLAFRGLENVRSFGSPTAGYASTNTVFRLYDGTQIVLTVGADVALRTGEVFCEEPIPPDVLTDSPEREAAAWIRSR